jgi:hypothetical protein
MLVSFVLVSVVVLAAIEPAASKSNGEATAAELTSMNFRLVISKLVSVIILTSPFSDYENGVVFLCLYLGVPVTNEHAKKP